MRYYYTAVFPSDRLLRLLAAAAAVWKQKGDHGKTCPEKSSIQLRALRKNELSD